jgi:hypothetical protein
VRLVGGGVGQILTKLTRLITGMTAALVRNLSNLRAVKSLMP